MGLSGRPFRSIMLSCYPASCHKGQLDLSLRPERKSYKIQRRARNFMDIKQKGPLPCLLFAAPFFGIFMAKGCVRFCREERNALDSVPYLISPPSFRQIFSSACFFAFSKMKWHQFPRAEGGGGIRFIVLGRALFAVVKRWLLLE